MDISKHFVTATNNPDKPSEGSLNAVKDITEVVTRLAYLVNDLCPDGRNKELAMTHLEDALVRINKSLYVKDS